MGSGYNFHISVASLTHATVLDAALQTLVSSWLPVNDRVYNSSAWPTKDIA
jgi:hypothetical protein